MSGDGHTNETRELNLDAIEARANLATGGPWFASVDDAVNAGAHRAVLFHGYEPEDAEFIVHARDDVPALVAEVRRLREDLSKAHYVMGTHAMRAIGVEPPS